ncbi:transcriptional regulator [Stenotrophobium rhamnosiphilum]|uniref:Transcriptional regulator n=1 Tax=Stenotrophobium rhamnosiphilum TaxID=2029166 RepID=A0A2T5MC02_9GAMM|nr:transcriptional regulator [Stenotrophobium rhamnosiphilum]
MAYTQRATGQPDYTGSFAARRNGGSKVSLLEKRFGQVVREEREKKGWSQELLAEAANLNRSYLGEIERGLVTPSLVTISKLAAGLDVAPSTLITRWENDAA